MDAGRVLTPLMTLREIQAGDLPAESEGMTDDVATDKPVAANYQKTHRRLRHVLGLALHDIQSKGIAGWFSGSNSLSAGS